jgi:hypothetical protein
MLCLITLLGGVIEVSSLNQNFVAASIKVDAVHAHALSVREVDLLFDMGDGQLLEGMNNARWENDLAIRSIELCRLIVPSFADGLPMLLQNMRPSDKLMPMPSGKGRLSASFRTLLPLADAA